MNSSHSKWVGALIISAIEVLCVGCSGASETAKEDPQTANEISPMLQGLPNFKTLEVRSEGDFDIVKFVFDVPGTRPGLFRFEQHPSHCGSGDQVNVAGSKFLAVYFDAQAIDPETGKDTFAPPSIEHVTPNLPSIKELQATCLGFEAEVSYVIGLPEGKQPVWFPDGNAVVVKVPH